jgi:CBS domain-containing protein
MSSRIYAGNIFSKGYNTVQESDTLSRCLESFKVGMPPVLAVLDDRGKYTGLITRRAIFRSKLDPLTAKVKTLMRVAPSVNFDTSISRLAKLMIESGLRQLPLFDKGKLLGFVTDENVIHAAVTEEWGSTKIEKIMTKAPHTIEASRSVGAVFSLMREYGISHVPVLDRGKLVGMVSIADILENVFWPRKRTTTGDVIGEKIETLNVSVSGIMARPVITISPDVTLNEAEKKMHDHDISCLVVLVGERLAGVVTKLDFLEPISQLEVVERRLTVQFAVKGIEISPDQQGFMMDAFDSFTRRYQEAFELGTLFVYMKTHGSTSLRGLALIHCRLQFRTVRGTYVSSSEGWGVEPTFRVALDRLEQRLLRSKELVEYNPKFARDYLRKVGLPQEEA